MAELKAVSYISIKGAPPVRFESLTAAERAQVVNAMCSNIGHAVSDYLSGNPEEAKNILKRR